MRSFFLLLLLTIISACTQTHSNRSPAESVEQKAAEKYYASRAEFDLLSFQEKELQQKIEAKSSHQGEHVEIYSGQSELEIELLKVQQKKSELQKLNTNLIEQNRLGREYTQPLGYDVWFDQPWRQHHDEIIVHNLEEFPLYQGTPVRQVSISTSNTYASILQLTNYVESWDSVNFQFKKNPENENKSEALIASIQCNKPVQLYTWPKTKHLKAQESATFSWYDSKFTAARPHIQISRPETECIMKFGRHQSKLNYGIKITHEDKELADLMNPEKKGEVCFLPKADKFPTPIQYFLSPNLIHTTCPIKIEKFQTLENSLDGINAKVKMLTGKELDPAYLKKGDPFAPLDFRNAPKLNAILISYLVFRADFSGQVLMQALRYHAEQGTLIRIAVSDVISLGKDRQMLYDFQAKYPNVKLLFYQYRSEGKGIKDWINTLHRTNHIKFFLTYSESQPEANAVLLGGRNIHDGFIFDSPYPNYVSSAVIKYNKIDGDEAWARWEDFETLFTSKNLVDKLMAQFFTVFHADYKKFFVRSYSMPVALNTQLDPAYLKISENEILMRSMVSIPFKDDMHLEKAFIALIDSAEKRLLLSTPYFNITDKILNALERASDRGVKIELITRLDLDGDTADIVLSDVNKKAINKIYHKIKVYEYTTKGKILHSKLVIVDDNLVMMGSVNLNLRSFYHDLENISFIYGKGFNKKIADLFEVYKKESKLLTEKQKTTWWKSILIKIIGTAL